MAYLINRYNGQELVVLEDGTIDTTTSLSLVGRNYTGYGEIQNENFLFLLENFSNTEPPLRPLSGQLWYNRTTGTINVYDGDTWRNVSMASVSPTPPSNFANGNIWLDSDTNQLFVRNNGEWRLIGPEALDGYQETKIKAAEIRDANGIPRPVLTVQINGITTAVLTNVAFEINNSTPIAGFKNLVKGVTLLTGDKLAGDLEGNSLTATRLQTSRTINGVQFNGSADITITARTTNNLIPGTYISGVAFNGSSETSWSIDASPNNIIGKIVARDSQGNFSAGTITANLVGNVVGNVNISTGNSKFNTVEANQFIGGFLSGNAFSASRLETARTINGVSFNGTANINVPASAETLTGIEIASNITRSSLTSLGLLTSLAVSNTGITVGSSLNLYVDQNSNYDVIKSSSPMGLSLSVTGNGDPNLDIINIIPANRAALLGAESRTTMIPRIPSSANLGTASYRFNKIYGNTVNSPTVDIETINSTAPDNNVTVNSNLIVSGNLVINGNLTTINSSEVQIEDLLLTVAKNALNPTSANGAGLYVAGALAELKYSATGDKWTINKKLDAGNNNIITTGLFEGTATSARYADLAENYLADKNYEFGTVLEFGGEFEVTEATVETTKIAGIVSKNPAYLMNSECAGTFVIPLALQGRVFCKVTGNIEPGDMLISAGRGYAKAEKNPKIGSVIGKSLQKFHGEEGVIEVVVGRI